MFVDRLGSDPQCRRDLLARDPDKGISGVAALGEPVHNEPFDLFVTVSFFPFFIHFRLLSASGFPPIYD